MQDDKRFLRKLREAVKRKGNRKRRRYLKDVEADPDDFSFGSSRCDIFDAQTGRSKKPRRDPS